MLLRVEGIVIRSMDYGEGNKIIHLLTPTMGKLSVMARGARKVKSRLTAVTQMFACGDYVIYKSGQMGTLNHAEMIDSSLRLREDLHMTAYASYAAEMVDRILGDDEISEALYIQFKAALAAIADGKDPRIVCHIFEMKMLALSGYLPDLENCASCGKPVGQSLLFGMQSGGILCESCSGDARQRIMPLSDKSLQLLRLFRRMDLTRLGTITLKTQTKEQLGQCMRALMDLHINVAWKSRHFIDQMDKYGV